MLSHTHPIPINMTQHGAWVEILLVPSRQQLEYSPKQKTKQPLNQKMGWEHFTKTHPHEKETSTANNIGLTKITNNGNTSNQSKALSHCSLHYTPTLKINCMSPTYNNNYNRRITFFYMRFFYVKVCRF